jgi:hypothetical protein
MKNIDVKDYDRMFCYLWHETEKLNECKFGERWVPAGVDAIDSCRVRVKQSLGVRKDLLREGEVVIHKIWDVTEYAKSIDRYSKQSRVDDHIRNQIGFRKGTTGEIHELDYLVMSTKVNKLLSKLGQPLPIAGLSTGQYNQATDVIEAFAADKNIVLAELCARFGKTIFSGAIATEIEANLTIVTSYVKTSFTSFEEDITSFEQFKGIVHVNTEEKDYQGKVLKALAEGKQVFTYLSLCNGGKRQDRIDFLFGLDTSRFLIIDEADYGAHKPGQSLPLINAVKSTDKVLIMTGTNADRAASIWKVDHMLSTTYFELLGHKKTALESC